jgi:hypothetical protein
MVSCPVSTCSFLQFCLTISSVCEALSNPRSFTLGSPSLPDIVEVRQAARSARSYVYEVLPTLTEYHAWSSRKSSQTSIATKNSSSVDLNDRHIGALGERVYDDPQLPQNPWV